MAKLKILFPLYPGITQLDFTGPLQVLSRARDAEVVVASSAGQDIAIEGLTLVNLHDLSKVDHCDVLCIPGGFGATDAILDEAFMGDIRRLGEQASYLTSVCTGSLILGAAGFLAGKRAATHWAWRDLLGRFGAIVEEARVVRDGRIITGGGVTAGLDFAFVLLAELCGEDHAKLIQLGLEYAPQPPFQCGRPELAAAETRQAFDSAMEPMRAHRRAQVDEAVRRAAASEAAGAIDL